MKLELAGEKVRRRRRRWGLKRAAAGGGGLRAVVVGLHLVAAGSGVVGGGGGGQVAKDGEDGAVWAAAGRGRRGFHAVEGQEMVTVGTAWTGGGQRGVG